MGNLLTFQPFQTLKNMTSTLTTEEIASLSDRLHGDPFSVLGLHKTVHSDKERLVLRAFRPEAKEVFGIIGKSKPIKLARLSNEGLFECVFLRRKKIADYSLKIISHTGEAFEIKDPYCYGKMIDEFDLQLWGEGNHKKAYDFIGAHPKK